MEEMPAFILLFTREQLPAILSKLGMVVDKRGRIVHKKTGEVVRCHICDEILTKDNVGGIFPRKVLICDDICCFSEYLVEEGVI
jgi:hypothetical protein